MYIFKIFLQLKKQRNVQFLYTEVSAATLTSLHILFVSLHLDLVKAGKREINNSAAKPLRTLYTPYLAVFIPTLLSTSDAQWQSLIQKCTYTPDYKAISKKSKNSIKTLTNRGSFILCTLVQFLHFSVDLRPKGQAV